MTSTKIVLNFAVNDGEDIRRWLDIIISGSLHFESSGTVVWLKKIVFFIIMKSSIAYKAIDLFIKLNDGEKF